jgi:hypothetical protein
VPGFGGTAIFTSSEIRAHSAKNSGEPERCFSQVNRRSGDPVIATHLSMSVTENLEAFDPNARHRRLIQPANYSFDVMLECHSLMLIKETPCNCRPSLCTLWAFEGGVR